MAERSVQMPYIVRARPRVGFLPIGRVDSAELQLHYDLGRELIQRLDADVVEMPLVSQQPELLDRVAELRRADVDLVVQYVLHGMSAEQQTLAGVKTDVPTVLWALPTNYSFASCASAVGALRDRGRRVRLVSASPGDEAVLAELAEIARVAYAIEQLKRCRIGTLGGIFPNLPADHYHRDVLADRLGPHVVHLPIALLQQYLAKVGGDAASVNAEAARLRAAFDVRVGDALLRKAIRFHRALQELAEELRLTAIALECHTELTPLFGINPCLGFADAQRAYLPICEGDVVRGVNMLAVRFLTGRAAYMGDVFNVQEDVLTLAHCGADCRCAQDGQVIIAEKTAPSHVGVDTRMAMCLPHLPEGQVTVTRLHGRGLDRLHLAMGEAQSADASGQLTVRVRLEHRVEFLQQLCGNHYVVAMGDLRPQLGLFCEWLGIQLSET